MEYKIFYNDKEDEFTKDISLTSRLDRYIKDKFYPAYVISMIANIYLLGGAIRDLTYAKEPKDLDFVVLNDINKRFIEEVFNKFNITYTYNSFGGYRIIYNNIKIDLWITNDLYSSMEYNVDGLYYDINTRRLISLTYKDFIDNGIKLVNTTNNRDKGKIKKLKEYENNYFKK